MSELKKDDSVFDLALDDTGWVGVDRESDEIKRLRDHLLTNNGIKGLEVVEPHEVERAARIFHRDGFVVVRDVLNEEQLEFMRGGCDRMDKDRAGNRGSHRYSFGSSSITGHLVHLPEWAMLIDLPTVTPIISAIFGSENYICRGGGGDFCLPGAVDYQRLHSDIGDRREHDGQTFGSFRDHRGMLTIRDLPCPYVCCNFLMVDLHELNGPTRQIPGTQHSREKVPRLSEEPEWMKLSTVMPAPAGSVLMRDVRAWHGGTPNLSDEVRAIPNCEFHAPWYREPWRVSMPRSVYETLSDHGKKISQYIVADSSEELETGYKDDLGLTPYLMRAENQEKDSR